MAKYILISLSLIFLHSCCQPSDYGTSTEIDKKMYYVNDSNKIVLKQTSDKLSSEEYYKDFYKYNSQKEKNTNQCKIKN